jgi:predicted DNA-binding transcriptional regulator AlpA
MILLVPPSRYIQLVDSWFKALQLFVAARPQHLTGIPMHPLPPGEQQQLLTEVQTSRILNISFRTLQAWRRERRGPSFVRVGRAVRYRQNDLDNWIKNQVVRPQEAAESDEKVEDNAIGVSRLPSARRRADLDDDIFHPRHDYFYQIEEFFDTYVHKSPGARVQSSYLYRRYLDFNPPHRNNYKVSQKLFSSDVAGLGFKREKHGLIYWYDIELDPEGVMYWPEPK